MGSQSNFGNVDPLLAQGLGSSRFESLILSHHSRFNVTCECNKEEINDDDEAGAARHACCSAKSPYLL